MFTRSEILGKETLFESIDIFLRSGLPKGVGENGAYAWTFKLKDMIVWFRTLFGVSLKENCIPLMHHVLEIFCDL